MFVTTMVLLHRRYAHGLCAKYRSSCSVSRAKLSMLISLMGSGWKAQLVLLLLDEDGPVGVSPGGGAVVAFVVGPVGFVVGHGWHRGSSFAGVGVGWGWVRGNLAGVPCLPATRACFWASVGLGSGTEGGDFVGGDFIGAVCVLG